MLFYSIMTTTKVTQSEHVPTWTLDTLPSQTIIRFKYAGGTSPNTKRTVTLYSFNWVGNEGYLKALDSSDCLKTYLYSKMSYIQPELQPELQPEPTNQFTLCGLNEEQIQKLMLSYERLRELHLELQQEQFSSHTDAVLWTSFVKNNHIIHMTYRNESFSRKVTFLHFDKSIKHSLNNIIVNDNGITKRFIINYIKVHEILEFTTIWKPNPSTS